ncbi:hypothetical protein G6F50_015442 [Rhizopus delemar]|uniref:Uncharacterized protein n=1 Tax=Rhizopus delemar TaxID=936053 RepID=A0A9P7C432_9FUNG|nr:hypothetical protein G6F50_015442 [Rhizopus delemar]
MWCTIAQQAHQVGQAGRGQRRVLAYHQVDQGSGAFNLRLFTGIGFGVVGHRIDARAAVTPLHAQQAAVVHAIQQMGAGIAGAAPVVGHPAVREGLIDLTRVHAATLAHEGQHVRRAALGFGFTRQSSSTGRRA